MAELTLPAPCKLNLFLHILGRQEDGYHRLQTVYQLLDYADTLHFTRTEDDEITVHPVLPNTPPKENLIYRVAKVLQTASKTAHGAKIQVKKKLPMGGGIGGGSSNAATTLLGLNHLWRCGLNLDQLASLGSEIGADIPVFVRGKTAWAEGIGVDLKALELEERWYLVLAPDCHVSTATVFNHKDLTRDSPTITVAAFFEKGGKNDCQPLVERLYPQVREAVDWLGQHWPGQHGLGQHGLGHLGSAQLTGTGACVFAAFPDEQTAQQVFAKRPKHLNGFVAKGVNNSPLHQHLP